MNILKISLSGSIIVLMILGLRAALLNKLPKRTFAVLWIIAIVALTLPFPFKTPVSLKNLKLNAVRENAVTERNAYIGEQTDFPEVLQETALTETEGQSELADIQAPLIGWAVGAAALAVFFILKHERALKMFKTSLPAQNTYIKEWLKAHKLKRNISVRVSDKISSPLTYGIIKPVILLPKGIAGANEQTLNYILSHEFVHIKYCDSLYKTALLAVLVVHWFNPLVWITALFASRDLELACDEAVLEMNGNHTKKAYAMLLIGLEEKKAQLNALCSGFGAASVKERIKNIMEIKKKTVAAIVASGLVIGGLTTAYAAVSPAADKDFIAITAVEDNKGSYSADMTSYDEYAKWGVEYDGGKDVFYYNGKSVMLFEDAVELEPGMTASKCSYYNPDGETCIKTVREPIKNSDGSTNPFGEIIGIVEMSDNEAKELIDIHTDYGTAQYTYVIADDAIETDEPNSSEYQASYSEVTATDDLAAQSELADKYKALGLNYDYLNGELNMSFNGKDVHALFDEIEGVWIANNMHGYNLDDAVDLEAVYENGKLKALDVVPCTHKDGIYTFEGGDAVYTYSVNEAAQETGDFSVSSKTVIEETAAASDNAAEEGTPLPDMFDKYKKYGIEYKESMDKNGDQIRNLYYKGKIVNSFADINPNGSVFTFGSSEQSTDGVDIQTVYKNGKLTGIEET